jgi:type IV pilus assembly protein PilE
MKTLKKSCAPGQTLTVKSAHAGFTLIELMITVAIVAILATIATTSYTSQVQKSRRTDARSALLDLAGRQEKLFSTTNAYATNLAQLGYSSAIVGSGYYTVTVTSPDNSQAQAGTIPTYLLTATVTNTQVSDTQCQTLSINQTGLQSSTPGPASTCWGN